jgi:GNAT superfamily N-acetyltransferase
VDGDQSAHPHPVAHQPLLIMTNPKVHVTPANVTITQPEPDPGLLDTIKPLYTKVYAEPPYHEGPDEIQDFVDRWNNHSRQPGFSIVLAHHEQDLIGFCFGFPLSANSRWWDGLLDPADPAVTAEDGRRTFALIELAVHATHRRQGIGRALHDTLLTDRSEQRATLLTRPEAVPALTAYTTWGYHRVGHLQPGPDAPVYLAMIRNLT